MRHPVAAFVRLFLSLGCWILLNATCLQAADGSEQDQFEEKAVARGVEKALRALKSDRAQWVKELESAYGSRVTNPIKEEEYRAWFDLVADKGAEWRRADSANPQIAELFDRVVRKLELGPVPTVRRDEFMKYAKKALVPGNPPAAGAAPECADDADKAFRVLDQNGDGVVSPEEMTAKLREDRVRTDTDGNGRIDKDEYRAYFQRRVTAAADAANAKAGDQNGRGTDPKAPGRVGKPGAGLPDWFSDLDTDKDGQIALHEWRRAGRPIAAFTEMDLDGDGLLTKEEYLRYVKLKESSDELPPAAGKPVKK